MTTLDMSFTPQEILVVLAVLVNYGGVMWFLASMRHQLRQDIEHVRQDILRTRLDVANEYMRKDSFRDVVSNLDSRFIRLEGKLDSTSAIMKEKR